MKQNSPVFIYRKVESLKWYFQADLTGEGNEVLLKNSQISSTLLYLSLGLNFIVWLQLFKNTVFLQKYVHYLKK